MNVTNPFTSGGWYPQDEPNGFPLQNPSEPPTFGALPSQGQPSSSQWNFVFHMSNFTTLNAIVTGPRNLKFFEVQTAGETTMVSKHNGFLARVKWDGSSSVEILTGGSSTNQSLSSYLRLSNDGMYRTMIIAGKSYIWLKHRSGGYIMSRLGPSSRTDLVEVRRSSDGTKLTLTMQSEAFREGLLEPCAVAVVLLYSNLALE
ncbi:hypothetical protein CVT26_012474 [Gymnopilus dilepis]|uniref:Uncharacterized protein n=1 Tax=Gymnopilus dilepis TaxID=231916 RepID=A0A409YCW4_9AGAR|nr:hypothetical protein CVT26_012474 [Gymnopilus dilepis]